MKTRRDALRTMLGFGVAGAVGATGVVAGKTPTRHLISRGGDPGAEDVVAIYLNGVEVPLSLVRSVNTLDGYIECFVRKGESFDVDKRTRSIRMELRVGSVRVVMKDGTIYPS